MGDDDTYTITSSDPEYDFTTLHDSFTIPTMASTVDTVDWNDFEVVNETEKRLEAIEKRLLILVPDPEKLEQWEALREAYDHYKSLEALIGNSEPENDS